MNRRDFGNVRSLPSGSLPGPLHRPQRPHAGTHLRDAGRQAGEHLAEARADLARGRWQDPDACPSQASASTRQEWLAARVDLKPTTRQQYAGTLRRHVRRPRRLRAGGADLRARPQLVRGLARSTSPTPTRQAYALLRTILNTAVDDEILLRNPCRIRGAGVARTAERPIATLAQVEALADAVYPRYRALVLMAAWTGARWGELIALTRDRRGPRPPARCGSIGSTSCSRPRATSRPGSSCSHRRPRPAGGRCTSRRTCFRRSPRTCSSTSRPAASSSSPTTRASRCTAGRFTTVWHRARERAGLPGFHFHDLRHTGNTLAATTGASTRELMARMGHASMRAAVLYQHATSERDQQIAEALSELAMQHRAPATSVRRLFTVPAEGAASG